MVDVPQAPSMPMRGNPHKKGRGSEVCHCLHSDIDPEAIQQRYLARG